MIDSEKLISQQAHFIAAELLSCFHSAPASEAGEYAVAVIFARHSVMNYVIENLDEQPAFLPVL